MALICKLFGHSFRLDTFNIVGKPFIVCGYECRWCGKKKFYPTEEA